MNQNFFVSLHPILILKIMAKIYGLFGSMTGKLADTVMFVRNGVQVARKYQPVVYNPSTSAQVAVRARLKLMSQLSAVMAPVIAIPKSGSVSSRNLFTKLNFSATSYSGSQASVNLSAVKITRGVLALPSLSVTRSGSTVNVALSSVTTSVSRVVYCSFFRQPDGTLRYMESVVVSTPGAGQDYPGVLTIPTSSMIFAYGIRDNSANAVAIFGDMTVPSAELIAQLIVTRRLTDNDISLTETQYASVPAQA